MCHTFHKIMSTQYKETVRGTNNSLLTRQVSESLNQIMYSRESKERTRRAKLKYNSEYEVFHARVY